MPIFGGSQQVTSITIKVNQLVAPPRHGDDGYNTSIELYISDLIHLILIQGSTGATESARAIRKKIKYGDTVDEQLRALQILELLVLNSGPKIGPVLARDDKLVELLKGVVNGAGKTAAGNSYAAEVSGRAKELAIGWKAELDGLDGYKYLAGLWKFIPRKKQNGQRPSQPSTPRTANTNVFESEMDEIPLGGRSGARSRSLSSATPPPRPQGRSPYTLSVSRDKDRNKKSKSKKSKNKRHGAKYADEQYRIPQINYKVEAPKIRAVISDCHTHTTALQNALLTLQRGTSPLDDSKSTSEFEKCRGIRRKVLRYLQFVGAGNSDEKSSEIAAMDEEFLGSLIYANEQLVEVFKRYDSACGYTDDNPAPNYENSSDETDSSYYTESEEEEPEPEQQPEEEVRHKLAEVTVGVSRPPPPRPAKPSRLAAEKPQLARLATNDTVGSDPFGDSAGAGTTSAYY